MTFILVLAALILLLYSGMPMFAGMLLFSVVGLLIVEGNIASMGEVVFGNINAYLLVAIPLFMLMAHFMVRGKVVDDLYATFKQGVARGRRGLLLSRRKLSEIPGAGNPRPPTPGAPRWAATRLAERPRRSRPSRGGSSSSAR